MVQEFNLFNEYEIPEISLCRPNRSKIGNIGRISEFTASIKFNNLSEISLTVLEYSDGIRTPFYDDIHQKNKIHVLGMGWFIIGDTKEINDGVVSKKIVPCISEESSLNGKSVTLLEGTYKFYDPLNNSDTIIGKIMGFLPAWSLGSVSASLWNKYRTFDITSKTLYSFMMTDISKAYECFFQFDTENRVINVYDINDAVQSTDIILSFDNLVKNVEITEKSDEFVSALAVTGGGDLDIRSVNPLGDVFIYDYTYPMENNMMSQGLIDAITAWNEVIDINAPIYSDKLAQYKDLNSDYIYLSSELSDLNAQIDAIYVIMKTRIDAGISDLSDLQNQINQLGFLKTDKQDEILDNRDSASILSSELLEIVNNCSIKNNFSSELYNELQEYTIESSYQNEYIIKTSSMTSVQVQEQAQNLYDQGKEVLKKISKPRYSFAIDSTNFIFLKEYVQFTNQLWIGKTIRVEFDDGKYFSPILLEMNINFYNPSDFSLTFGNRMRLDDDSNCFADLFEESVNAGKSVGVNSSLWNDWSNNYQESVSDFISGALDASKNSIVNSVGQEITIDGSGLRGKKLLSDGNYDPQQIWITTKNVALTKDGWNTVSTAIGEITLPDGSKGYGVAGGVILGNLVASENLIIQNQNNKFLVDGNGVTVVDADITVTASNQLSRTIISPTNGFNLQTKSGGSWTNSIYLDTSGNATFSGTVIASAGTIGGFSLSSSSISSSASDSGGKIISFNTDGTGRFGALKITKSGTTYTAEFTGKIVSTTGTIGGWTISSSGLTSPFGDYIKSNGTGKLGLLTYTNSSATFNGIVRANNIAVGGSNGYIGGSQIGSSAVGSRNLYKGDYGTQSDLNRISADLATLNSIMVGNAYATTILTGQLYVKGFAGSGTYYPAAWRTVSTPTGTIYALTHL